MNFQQIFSTSKPKKEEIMFKWFKQSFRCWSRIHSYFPWERKKGNSWQNPKIFSIVFHWNSILKRKSVEMRLKGLHMLMKNSSRFHHLFYFCCWNERFNLEKKLSEAEDKLWYPCLGIWGQNLTLKRIYFYFTFSAGDSGEWNNSV